MTTLRQRARFFGDMAKGGYLQDYDIIDGADVVGAKSVYRKDRESPELVAYFDRSGREFATARKFAAAYEAEKEKAATP